MRCRVVPTARGLGALTAPGPPWLFGRLCDRYRENDLVLLDIKINSEPVEPLAAIVHRDNAYYVSPQGSWDRAT